MKPIPAAPTDNLYKFIAIVGLWMFFGFLAFLGWFVYLEFQFKDNTVALMSYLSSLEEVSEIKARLESIENGDIDKNKLDWVPKVWNLKQEKHALKIAKENHIDSIAKNQHAVNSKIGEELRYLSHPVVITFGIFYIAVMLSFLLIGFIKWKRKIQDPDIYFKSKNTELIEKSIKKTDLEINMLQKEHKDNQRD